MLKEEFDPNEGLWFDENECYVDLGFLGIQKDYTQRVRIPHKKPKGGKLDDKQKKQNRESSKERIVVEHVIGGMKRYFILQNQSRIRNVARYNQVTGICAGLWNFSITH